MTPSTPPPATRPRGGLTRATLLRGAAAAGAGGAGVAALGLSGSSAGAKPSRAQDVEVLNVLLLVEQVQDAFYADAVGGTRLRGEALAFARAVAPQEREHVALLQRRLGGAARKPPEYAFYPRTKEASAFVQAAVRLEELAVAAYVGQGPNLTAARIGEVARIASVEARHAAWIRTLSGDLPAPKAADEARSGDAVTRALRDEGFIR